jgi:hypothetical protein
VFGYRQFTAQTALSVAEQKRAIAALAEWLSMKLAMQLSTQQV